MKHLLIAVTFTALFLLACSTPGIAGEKKAAAPKKATTSDHQGEIRVGTKVMGADDDEGRFRQDTFQTDDWTGGLERFWFDGTSGKVRLEMDLKALYDDDYGGTIKLSREGLGYLKVDYNRYRHYYDGSGSDEIWDPNLYGFSLDFLELADEEMYTDRTDFNLELGWRPQNGFELTTGWHHWERQGEDVYLRGGRVRVTNNASLPRIRAATAINEVNGESDSAYLDMAYTIKEKYNLRFRHEYEIYRDNQQTTMPRFKDGGLEQLRTFEDEPRFHQNTTMLMFDTQFEENTYVTANYMHDSLHNNSTRDAVRRCDANPNRCVGTDTDSERVSTVDTLGILHTTLVQVKGLSLAIALRS